LHAQNDLEICIRDRGPGVPGADLERIFEPFYRVAESRDRDSGGEGIGLAITAQVMKAHGGSASAAIPPKAASKCGSACRRARRARLAV
jgi:signal transduction histidine kinase